MDQQALAQQKYGFEPPVSQYQLRSLENIVKTLAKEIQEIKSMLDEKKKISNIEQLKKLAMDMGLEISEIFKDEIHG